MNIISMITLYWLGIGFLCAICVLIMSVLRNKRLHEGCLVFTVFAWPWAIYGYFKGKSSQCYVFVDPLPPFLENSKKIQELIAVMQLFQDDIQYLEECARYPDPELPLTHVLNSIESRAVCCIALLTEIRNEQGILDPKSLLEGNI